MSDRASLSVRWLRWALAAVASVVVVEAMLGFAGATAAAAPAIALGAAGAATVAARRGWRALRHPVAGTASAPWTRADIGAALALVIALGSRLGEGLHHADGAFTYDVLSYHLHLPASWWAAGRVAIVPTPFGDQAPAYAPANAELIDLLALAATGNLRLAHAGQAPFAALAALAIVATGRQLGVARRLAAGAALAFLMIPEVWQQATGAMADLALASFLLACLPFLLRLRDRRTAEDVLALGAATGLAVGTKYAGIVLALPVVAAAILLLGKGTARGSLSPPPADLTGPSHAPPPRRDDGRAGEWSRLAAASLMAVMVLACGGFWYVRNQVLTGDPTFPVTLRVARLTLGRGLYGAAEMSQWRYHLPVSDLQPLLEMFTETGWGFLACLAGGLGVAVARRRWVIVALFGALVALVWLALPYQQSRFLFAAWGIAALAAAEAAQNASLPLLRELALAPAIAGAALQFPTGARLLVAGLWAVAAGLALRQREAPPGAPRTARALSDATTWLAPLAVGLLALLPIAWTRAHPDAQSAHVGDDHDEAWAYVGAHMRGRHFAYAGSNLPLPLWGWGLENRVRYVNVAGKLTDVLHDFRAVPIQSGTAEPAPERAAPARADWLANLTTAGIDALFVARLYPEVAPSMPHDGEGFPTERAWADALPERFHLAYASGGVRIYDLRAEGGAWPTEERR